MYVTYGIVMFGRSNRKITVTTMHINQSIMTHSDQPELPAVAIVRQNGLSSASSRASVADTPVSWQIW